MPTENLAAQAEDARCKSNARNAARRRRKRAEGHPGYVASREYILLSAARQRSRRDGIECTLTLKDIVIPKRCPVLGIELRHRTGTKGPCETSPTLDRRDGSLGYVPGNVFIISHRANRIKSNATPAELQAVADYAAGKARRRR